MVHRETPMTPATATPQGWSMNTLIDWMEHKGKIDPPFTPDERALAAAAAEAYYFWAELTELPARAPWNSAAWGAMFLGIHRVRKRRKGACKDDLIHLLEHGE